MNVEDVLYSLKLETKAEYLQNIEPYWYKNTIDKNNGGFFGQVRFDNTPVYNADKGGILNARILWTFSAAYKMFKTRESEEMAHRAFDYLVKNLIDDQYGGIYWMVDHKGDVKDDRKHVYVQAFAIYGLMEYYSAFTAKEALDNALELYHLIEKHCKDEKYGGYFEAYSRDWKLIDDVRLSDKDKNVPKSMNTHLHVLEGYTNLYRYSPSKNIGRNLNDLLGIFDRRIFTKIKDSLICFMGEDWTPKSSMISYGHDIEASWLCLEAAKVLGVKHWENVFSTTALKVSRNVIFGTDDDGGIVNELTQATIIDSNKDWWPQAEALVGHLNAFEISGRVEFLKAAVKSWEFIKKYVIDREFGEWFEKVDRNGNPYVEMDKVRSWKAPYHNSRALFEVIRRVDQLLQSTATLKIPVNVEKTL